VFGTAQPPYGLSGALRRGAYAIPEHRARHWMLLMLADRVELVEHRLVGPGPALIAGTAVLVVGALAVLRRRR
jgi:MYXO-CTERM domain-containing protein